MVVAKSEQAYTALKRAFKERDVDKRYHAVVQGHLDPSAGTIDAPIDRHPTEDYRWAVVSGGTPERDPLRHPGGVPGGEPARRPPGDRPNPPDPGAPLRAAPPLRGRPHLRRRPDLAARLGLTRQWLHARELRFEHPTTRRACRFTAPYPADLQHALEVLRDAD